jgi:hypothetical protein
MLNDGINQFESVYADGFAVLEPPKEEIQWKMGPWVDGFDPQVLGPRVGPVMSANNRRPDQYPVFVQDGVNMVAQHGPIPFKDEILFARSYRGNVPIPESIPTNTELNLAKQTLPDGVPMHQVPSLGTELTRKRNMAADTNMRNRAAFLRQNGLSRQAQDLEYDFYNRVNAQ